MLAAIQANFELQGEVMRNVLAGVVPIGLKLGCSVLVIRLGAWYLMRLADIRSWGGKDRYDLAQSMGSAQRKRYRAFLNDFDYLWTGVAFDDVHGARDSSTMFADSESRRRRRQWGM